MDVNIFTKNKSQLYDPTHLLFLKNAATGTATFTKPKIGWLKKTPPDKSIICNHLLFI